jgi:hypothetical protein
MKNEQVLRLGVSLFKVVVDFALTISGILWLASHPSVLSTAILVGCASVNIADRLLTSGVIDSLKTTLSSPWVREQP